MQQAFMPQPWWPQHQGAPPGMLQGGMQPMPR